MFISAFHAHIYNGIVAITLLSITGGRVFRKRFHRPCWDRCGAPVPCEVFVKSAVSISNIRVRFSHGKQRLRAVVIGSDNIIYVAAAENCLGVRLLRQRRPINQWKNRNRVEITCNSNGRYVIRCEKTLNLWTRILLREIFILFFYRYDTRTVVRILFYFVLLSRRTRYKNGVSVQESAIVFSLPLPSPFPVNGYHTS